MTESLKVLIVEDQHDIAANIWDFLERRGHDVDHAPDGETGLMHALRSAFDVIVLDLGLPRLDGLDLCRQLREAGSGTPVLMLTARDTLDDKLRGFAEGADDYMVKPFELKELEARIRAVHRRGRPSPLVSLVTGPLQLETESMTARRDGQRISLTRTQCGILELLMTRSPGVVSHSSLMQSFPGSREADSASLHTHMYDLRNLIDKPFGSALIQTVHGIGYRLVLPE